MQPVRPGGAGSTRAGRPRGSPPAATGRADRWRGAQRLVQLVAQRLRFVVDHLLESDGAAPASCPGTTRSLRWRRGWRRQSRRIRSVSVCSRRSRRCCARCPRSCPARSARSRAGRPPAPCKGRQPRAQQQAVGRRRDKARQHGRSSRASSRRWCRSCTCSSAWAMVAAVEHAENRAAQPDKGGPLAAHRASSVRALRL